jgi:tetratricopeptide (TPR) repeat protein
VRMIAAAVLACLLALPGRAGANPHLAEGLRLLNEMEDARAIAALRRALDWPQNTPGLRAKIYLNIGIAHGNLLNREAASESFRRALAQDPSITPPERTSPKIKDLFQRVRAELKQRRSKPPPPPAEPGPQPPPPPPAPTPARSSYLPAWIAAGAAGGSLVTAIVLGALSRSAANNAEDISLTYDEAKAYHDKATHRALGANIMFGVAGAAAIASGVLFYLGYRNKEKARARVSLAADPTGVLLRVHGPTW